MTRPHGIHSREAELERDPMRHARSVPGDIASRQVPPIRHGLELYVWGKHPAWRDFIDGALLPAPPAGFRDFHRTLRTPIESVYAIADRDPRLLLWQDRAGSALVLVLPSRDAGDPATGGSRRSPLFVGLSGPVGAIELLALARWQLPELAAALRDESTTAVKFLALISAAQSTLNRPSDSSPPKDPPARSARSFSELSDLFRSAALGLGADPSRNRRQLTMVCGGTMGAAHLMQVGIARLNPEAIRRAIMAPDHAGGAPVTMSALLDASGYGRSADRIDHGNENRAPSSIPAPSLPPSQSTACDTPFVFSTAAGNAIRLVSANPRRKTIRVRLCARRGTIRLASVAGLTFSLGDGVGDRVVMEFGGPVMAVNAALDGLRFSPSRGFTGTAALRVTAQDPSLRLACARSIDTSVEIEVK